MKVYKASYPHIFRSTPDSRIDKTKKIQGDLQRALNRLFDTSFVESFMIPPPETENKYLTEIKDGSIKRYVSMAVYHLDQVKHETLPEIVDESTFLVNGPREAIAQADWIVENLR